MNKPNLLFVGLKGSGKTTQIALLKKKYNYCVLSISEQLRSLAETDSQIRHIVSNGLATPPSLIEYIMVTFINENKGKSIIIDGSPYDEEQLEVYNKVLTENNLKITIIELQTETSESIQRLENRKRLDSGNNKELVHRYLGNVMKLHRQILCDSFIEINANSSIEKVFSSIEYNLNLS